ncbi:MAG: acyl-CoA dehydrogenase, partial [Flavobacteriaceae bacterium]|nr:acyl-CoA dehydrogenase [Flavobacteriaceae bacterium]
MENTLKGGEFIIKETKSADIFITEEFTEEQVMMKDAVKEFVDREIWPNKERFEHKDYVFTEEIMQKAG